MKKEHLGLYLIAVISQLAGYVLAWCYFGWQLVLVIILIEYSRNLNKARDNKIISDKRNKIIDDVIAGLEK
jgi:hypothetical protein